MKPSRKRKSKDLCLACEVLNHAEAIQECFQVLSELAPGPMTKEREAEVEQLLNRIGAIIDEIEKELGRFGESGDRVG